MLYLFCVNSSDVIKRLVLVLIQAKIHVCAWKILFKSSVKLAEA